MITLEIFVNRYEGDYTSLPYWKNFTQTVREHQSNISSHTYPEGIMKELVGRLSVYGAKILYSAPDPKNRYSIATYDYIEALLFPDQESLFEFVITWTC